MPAIPNRLSVVVAAWVVVAAPGDADWPQFRGDGTGAAGPADAAGSAPSPPDRWDASAVRWTAAVPGFGWSSPVVAGGRVFLTTAVADAQPTPPTKGPGGGEKQAPDKPFRYGLHCLDARTGKSLWSRVAATGKPSFGTHITNTYASETPATDGRRVYAYFGNVGLFCFDLDGAPLWSRDLGARRSFANWGTSNSPVTADGRVFVQCDNEESSFVAALDGASGKELWRAARPEKSTWSTPVVWKSAVRTELVLMGTRRVRSYDPTTGNVLWELATDEGGANGGGGVGNRPGGGGGGAGGGGKSAAGGCKSTPVATATMIYLGMAPKQQGQQLGPMWAVRAGAAGDVSLRPGQASNASVAWYRPDAGPHFASAVVTGGLLYVVPPHDGAIRCFDAETGRTVYQQPLPGAGDFKASPVVRGGRVFATDERGTTFAVKVGRTFELLARGDLGDRIWASAALSGGAAFVRGPTKLYSIGSAAPVGATPATAAAVPGGAASEGPKPATRSASRPSGDGPRRSGGGERTGGGARPGSRGGPGGTEKLKAVAYALPDLSPDQTAKLDEAFVAYQKASAATRDGGGSPRADATSRADEKARDTLRTSVEAALTDAQKSRLRAELSAGSGDPGAAKGGPITSLREHLREVGLTPEQEDKIQDLVLDLRAEVGRAARGADDGSGDRGKRIVAVSAEYRPKILAVLTDAQRAKLDEVERKTGGRRGPGGEGGGSRRAAPARDDR